MLIKTRRAGAFVFKKQKFGHGAEPVLFFSFLPQSAAHMLDTESHA